MTTQTPTAKPKIHKVIEFKYEFEHNFEKGDYTTLFKHIKFFADTNELSDIATELQEVEKLYDFSKKITTIPKVMEEVKSHINNLKDKCLEYVEEPKIRQMPNQKNPEGLWVFAVVVILVILGRFFAGT